MCVKSDSVQIYLIRIEENEFFCEHLRKSELAELSLRERYCLDNTYTIFFNEASFWKLFNLFIFLLLDI